MRESERIFSPKTYIKGWGSILFLGSLGGVFFTASYLDGSETNNLQPACVKQAEPGDSLAGFQSRLLEAGDKNIGSMTTSNGTKVVEHKPQVSEFMIAGHVSESTCREVGGVVIDIATAQSGNVIEAVRNSVQQPK